MLNSISVSVADDDDVAGQMRVRVRQKRKRPVGLWRRARRAVLRYWPVLLFLPAVVLLMTEALRLGGSKRPLEEKGGGSDPVSRSAGVEESAANLNRLDPTMHRVNGTRVRCLEILGPEQIHNLEFPGTVELNSPIRKVFYKTGSSEDKFGGNYSSSRFNLFTGYQSLHEREESYKVSETALVHCGFYNEIGGFKISDEDKNYMRTCKVVVSTCAFGGGDDLYQPIGMTEASLRKVCFVAFWDEITRSFQEKEGKIIGEDLMIGKWRIVVVKDLPFSDQRLNGKIPKLLGHRLFPEARYSIWVDSKSQFRRDPIGVLEALLWRTRSILAISEHGARSSLYDEGKAVVKKNKATPEEVEKQLNQYRQDGIPDDKRINGKKALAEASVIVREHTPFTNLFMCLWFNEVVRFTSRDQLSFPYVLRRLKMQQLYMFPVCTRKDLVNSIGHKRKVKPLERLTS